MLFSQGCFPDKCSHTAFSAKTLSVPHDSAKISAPFQGKAKLTQHVELSRAPGTTAERQDGNGMKLPCCYLRLRNKKGKGSAASKGRINQHDGKMVEPHRSRFFCYVHPVCLCW